MATILKPNYDTVKLDYKELTIIMNKMNTLVWFSIFNQWNFMLITKNFFQNHGNNEQYFWKFLDFNKISRILKKFLGFWINFKEFNEIFGFSIEIHYESDSMSQSTLFN